MKKRTSLCAALGLALYVLLLGLLMAAESAYGNSGIQSFTDALWYSLVTITTVGYGDMYPVSPLGRIIGVFFLMLSMGFLAFLAGVVFSLLSGRLWPAILLRIKRRQRWFVFSDYNSASDALARDLKNLYPDSLIAFCNCSRENIVQRNRKYLYLSNGITAMPVPFTGEMGNKIAFLISENELKNRNDAYALCKTGIELYCRGEEAGESSCISFFDPLECCARQYWKSYPLLMNEHCVLLVGDGRCAQALLDGAILANCRTPMQITHYHMFGNWQDYRQYHYCLNQALAIDCEAGEKDALFFHEASWSADADLIARADRIVFCLEDEDENARCVHHLERFFVHKAQVHARTSHPLASGMRFGAASEIYTAELVMKRQLDRLAEHLHEHYRRMTAGAVPLWSELDPFKKESNRAAADHIPTKIRLLTKSDHPESGSQPSAAEIYKNASDILVESCRRNEHERWMRFHSLHNWQYAPDRNDHNRRHPSILPYEQLTPEERAKDDYAWQQLVLLAEDAEIQEWL